MSINLFMKMFRTAIYFVRGFFFYPGFMKLFITKCFEHFFFPQLKMLQTTAILILCQTVYRLQLQLFISCSRCRQPSNVLPLISMQHCFTTIYSQRSLSSFQWSCAFATLSCANIFESSGTTKKRFTHLKIYYIFSNIHYYSFSRSLFKHFSVDSFPSLVLRNNKF